MICLDELQSTIKRLELLQNNIDDVKEQFTCMNLRINLMQIHKQISTAANTAEYAHAAEEWKASLPNKD